jgi:hypothetical protein
MRDDMRKTIRRFLRDAINPKALELLVKGASIKGELTILIQKLEEDGRSVLAAIRKRIFLTTAGIYSMGWSWGWRCGAV